MVERADTYDLGSYFARSGGSNPSEATTLKGINMPKTIVVEGCARCPFFDILEPYGIKWCRESNEKIEADYEELFDTFPKECPLPNKEQQ